MEDEAVERNPSPPREFEDEAETFRQDIVGNTTISKKWIYMILMKVCTEVDGHKDSDETAILDISEDLQDDMCRLWDLCIEEDVADFLVDSDAIELLCRVLSASKSPRMTEIIVGILGNMACSKKSCDALSQNPEALLAIISLFSCRDSRTLVELGRLVATCLVNKSSQNIWFDFLESNILNFIGDVTFILSSNSNNSVLKYILEVIDISLDSRDSMLMSFSTRDFSNIVAEAGLQMLQSEESTAYIVTPLHILYLITAVEDNNNNIFASNNIIFGYVSKCFRIWNKLDDFSIADENPSAIPLASGMTVYYTLLKSSLSCADSGNNFMETVTKSQKQDIVSVSASTLKYCCSISTSPSHSKSLLHESAENISPEKETENGTDTSSISDKLIPGVPLHDIANDLMSVLTELEWDSS